MRPESELTLGRLTSGIAIGALVFAVVGGLGTGTAALLTTGASENQETSSEAAGWFIVFTLLGALALAPVGSVLGLVQRVWGQWIRPPWVLPLIGLLGGFAASTNAAADQLGARILIPVVGAFTGLAVHLAFAGLVARR